MYTLIIEDRSGNITKEFSFEEGAFTMGRVEGNDIVLASNSVSRTHARIYVNQGRCFIEDLNSSNGVVVDGQKVPSAELNNASQIRVGDFTLYLEATQRGKDPGQDVLRTHIVSNSSDTYKLIRVGDMFAGEEFNLTEQFNTIGRTDDNFILLSDPSISRNHGRIVNQGLMYTCEDLGSSNGTRVNGKPCKKPVQLNIGDEVQFGNVRFIFVPSNQQIDVAAYAAPPARSSGAGVIVLLIFVFLVILGGIGFAVYIFVLSDDDGGDKEAKDDGPSEEELLDQEVKLKFDEALKSVQSDPPQWPNARTYLKQVLELDPTHTGASGLLVQVEFELENRSRFDEGVALMGEDPEAAKERFALVDEKSSYHESAQKEIENIDSTLALRIFGRGKRACDDKIEMACIETICEALVLNPDLSSARDYMREMMTHKKIRKKKDLKEKIKSCLNP